MREGCEKRGLKGKERRLPANVVGVWCVWEATGKKQAQRRVCCVMIVLEVLAQYEGESAPRACAWLAATRGALMLYALRLGSDHER